MKISKRWIIVFVGCFGLFNAFAMRICLSIAITEMTIPPNSTSISSDETCSNPNNITSSSDQRHGQRQLFDWSEHTQGVILSSFYWSYLFTNLLGGMIAEKFGGKHTLGLGILSTALLTLLTPLSIFWGDSTALICLRFLMGLGEGTTYPALNVLLAQWIPEDERSKAGAIVYAGAPLGSTFGMTVSGLIMQYSTDGWPAVFYFFGTLGVISFVLNCVLCYSKPVEHPTITSAEAEYLKLRLKNTHGNTPSPPWGYILRSKPVWALVVLNFGNAWGFFTLASDMPKYLKNVLKFSVEDNGYFSSLPYLCMWFLGYAGSHLADRGISQKKISTTAVRKIGSSIASIGPAVFIVAASYAGCNGFLVIALVTIGLTLKGCSYFSILINALDLSPNYVGTLTGLVNGLSTLSGIISPYLVGVLTPNQLISEWRIVFWIVCAFYLISNTVYLIYGSGELQEWNDPSFLEKKRNPADGPVKPDEELMPLK